jgi:pyrroloquinoline-quinone synthase
VVDDSTKGARCMTASRARKVANQLCPQDKLSAEEFLGRLRDVGRQNYHDKHEFHLRLNAGTLSRAEVRSWIKNRFYYQMQIPIKDAVVLSKLPTREDRRRWVQRIKDHDGDENEPGGIEAWLCFGEAAGLSRDEMLNQTTLLPGVRFAVDAYVNFCRLNSWYEAVASSLTEMFSPSLISERMAAIRNHYPWIDESGLQYFQKRLSQAPVDCDHALQLVLDHGDTVERQRQALQSLSFKCDVLWTILDAIEFECAGGLDESENN